MLIVVVIGRSCFASNKISNRLEIKSVTSFCFIRDRKYAKKLYLGSYKVLMKFIINSRSRIYITLEMNSNVGIICIYVNNITSLI